MAKGTWNYCINCGEMVWAPEELKAVTCPKCGKVILTRSATDESGCGLILGVAFMVFVALFLLIRFLS